MNKSAIEKFAQYARKTLIELVTQKARYYGVTTKEIFSVESESSDAIVIHGTVHSKKIKEQRDMLVKEVKAKGFEQVVEEVAYTWFNRFAALRFMEVNEYLPTGLRVFSSIEPDKGEPDLLTHALSSDLPRVNKDEIFRYRDVHDDEGLYKYLLIAQCNALNKPLPFLFETISDYTELLFPDNMLAPDSLLRRLVSDIPEEDWREIEIVGWLYQFYISDKKAQVIGKIVKKEDIPAATQLFTPKWIVQYMVENSLGRIWLEMHQDSTLKNEMHFLVVNPENKSIKREPMRPEEITCMDPCCGSGHILVYMFDILYSIYEEMGYVGREIPSLILKNNLYGTDIDRRAVQLSSFALMMKAREKDRQFFSRSILPHVIEIQESNEIDLGFLLKMDQKQWTQFRTKIKQHDMFDKQEQDDIFDWVSDQRGKISTPSWVQTLQQLVEQFLDAKNFGSLLRITDDITNNLCETKGMLDLFMKEGELFEKITNVLQELVKQAEILTKKYVICVTNPPYMGGKALNAKLKTFLRSMYEGFHTDIYAAFFIRCSELTQNQGYIGLVSPFTWMFIASYEKLRQHLIDNTSLQSLVKPEYHSFFDSAFVPLVTFVFKKAKENYNAIFIDLSHETLASAQSSELLKAIRDTRVFYRYAIDTKRFLNIPGCPIAYALSSRQLDTFASDTKMSDIAEVREGINTGDNDKFLRLWHEVDLSRSSINGLQTISKWYPHNKGGNFRKWYGNNEYVLDWENDGHAIRNLRDSEGTLRSRPQNTQYFFRPGITWSSVSCSGFSGRYFPEGYTFNSTGRSLFSEYQRLPIILGFLNSKIAFGLLSVLAPTLSFTVGNIADLPIFFPENNEWKNRVRGITTECVLLAKADWDYYERSWDFSRFSILIPSVKTSRLELSWNNWNKLCEHKIERMCTLESENNRLFIEAYGFQDELKPNVQDEHITLTKPNLQFDMESLISYVIGCMMGRYSIDAPGLVFAGGNWGNRWKKYALRRQEMENRRQQDLVNGELLTREEPYEIPEGCTTWTHSPSFPEDDDGIIPLLADDYFPDDGTSRIVEFLRVTFGEKTLAENLQFLAENLLKSKGDESPTQVIRRYLCTQFFKDHSQIYKKRPIYWLFTSGPERAFQALIYMHRYTPSMLAKLRTEYLHELQGKVEIRINHLQSHASTGTPKEQRDASKLIANLHKQQEELRKYDELLRHYADMQIEINLDDGVKVNYAKFGPLLAPIPGLKQGDDE